MSMTIRDKSKEKKRASSPNDRRRPIKNLRQGWRIDSKTASAAGKKFEELVRIMETLRGSDGCPWDKAQSAMEIRDFFLEEVYEAVEALEAGDVRHLAEELGDVLMEVVFLSRIHEERERFTVSDALDKINRKMIARHPHVFGEKMEMTAKGVKEAWQERKLVEKNRQSILDDPGPATPSLLAAFLIGRRVAGVGFDWPSASGALEKVREETAELEEAVRTGKKAAIAEEMGDLFFSLANVARKLGINPEVALRRANDKFTRRFRRLEKELKASGKKLGTVGLKELDAIWNRNKAIR